ncbi:hypothetical protein BDZ91DRAFT_778645 [Kalaharituber pfeilii]|nr:hypothetical protein BDZ91DRAFT_778645 [Kalaharituber pfeilii]
MVGNAAGAKKARTAKATKLKDKGKEKEDITFGLFKGWKQGETVDLVGEGRNYRLERFSEWFSHLEKERQDRIEEKINIAAARGCLKDRQYEEWSQQTPRLTIPLGKEAVNEETDRSRAIYEWLESADDLELIVTKSAYSTIHVQNNDETDQGGRHKRKVPDTFDGLYADSSQSSSAETVVPGTTAEAANPKSESGPSADWGDILEWRRRNMESQKDEETMRLKRAQAREWASQGVALEKELGSRAMMDRYARTKLVRTMWGLLEAVRGIEEEYGELDWDPALAEEKAWYWGKKDMADKINKMVEDRNATTGIVWQMESIVHNIRDEMREHWRKIEMKLAELEKRAQAQDASKEDASQEDTPITIDSSTSDPKTEKREGPGYRGSSSDQAKENCAEKTKEVIEELLNIIEETQNEMDWTADFPEWPEELKENAAGRVLEPATLTNSEYTTCERMEDVQFTDNTIHGSQHAYAAKQKRLEKDMPMSGTGEKDKAKGSNIRGGETRGHNGYGRHSGNAGRKEETCAEANIARKSTAPNSTSTTPRNDTGIRSYAAVAKEGMARDSIAEATDRT